MTLTHRTPDSSSGAPANFSQKESMKAKIVKIRVPKGVNVEVEQMDENGEVEVVETESKPKKKQLLTDRKPRTGRMLNESKSETSAAFWKSHNEF